MRAIPDVIVLPSAARKGREGTKVRLPLAKAMLLMTVPSIPLHQIYAVPNSKDRGPGTTAAVAPLQVRFVVGFFEAPFLPYLQDRQA